MNLKTATWVVFPSAALLTLLFYKQDIGLNLLIFETLLLAWLFLTKQIDTKNTIHLVTAISCFLTAIFTVVIYSTYSYLIHFLVLFTFIGALNYPNVRSITTAYLGAWSATLLSIVTFFKRLFNTSSKGKKGGGIFRRWYIFLVPLLIIFVFIAIYSNANTSFGSIVGGAIDSLNGIWNVLFKNLDWGIISTYIFCLFLSIFLLVRYTNKYLANKEMVATLQLKRVREKPITPFNNLSLKNELRAGVFLLITLNLLLLFVNFLDVKNVWIGFEWSGQTLKEFVHEGTYLLILSILISIGIVLYYFRRNLNFYRKNGLLKKLSYIWIAQNVFLAISVGIRNFWYIEYYSLAYKRIGVIFFLIITIYGLYTVFKKVKERKSSFYLFRNNAMCLFIVFVATSAVPWDNVIAEYNFAHADTSYLELDYLVDFSNKALPSLDRPTQEIAEIKANQDQKFLPDSDRSAASYTKTIDAKKDRFKIKWEGKNWLSWNLAEAMAYKKLFAKQE